MQKNVGTKDAHVRTTIAVVAVVGALFLNNQPYLQIILALIAGALAASAFFRTCFLYHFLGKNTSEEVTTSTPAPSQDNPVQESGQKTE